MATAYLNLGSNIDAEKYLQLAAGALRKHFTEAVFSPVYRSKSVGFDGPDFLNCGARIQTKLQPQALNTLLHEIENQHGRDRSGPRYSSRTLDIDIVLYDDLVMSGADNLTLPRAELLKHAFVLKPTMDLAPQLRHPKSGKSLAEHWQQFPSDLKELELDPLAL